MSNSYQLAKRFRLFMGQLEEFEDGPYMLVVDHLAAMTDPVLRAPLICDNCGKPGRDHHMPLFTCAPIDAFGTALEGEPEYNPTVDGGVES